MTRMAWRAACVASAALSCAVGVDDATRFELSDTLAEPGTGATEQATSAASGADDGDDDDDAAMDLTGEGPGESDDGSTGVADCTDDVQADPRHCGACGHDCLGGACVDGLCQPVLIAQGVNTPWHMRVHGSTLFIGSDDGLVSLPIDGGPRTILAGGQVRGLVVDDERVYWVDAFDHHLRSAPIEGGPAELVVQFITTPYPLESDGANLYWIDEMGVMKRPKQNGIAAPIVPVDGSGFVPWQLAVDADHVYWRSEDGELRAATTTGLEDQVLATGNEMRAVAVNSTHVFAMRRDGFEEINTLLRIPKAGGPVEELISGQPNCLPLIADEETVYWATEFGAPTRILSMPVAGGPVRILVEMISNSAIFTVADGVLYFADQELGTIQKLVP